MWQNGTYVYLDSPGTFSVGKLDLKSSAIFKYSPDATLHCDTGRIDVRYQAVISAESIYIRTGTLNVEAGGKITTSAIDRPEDTLDSPEGQGTSSSVEHAYASGAGHASEGGSVYDTSGQVILQGGSYYGRTFEPGDRGSKGGNSLNGVGGTGGGIINLFIGFTLFVDGEIDVNGAHSSSKAGGGSAGSINGEVYSLEGHGQFLARGGNGASGGAGGRIALYLGSKNHYEGSYTALGGNGGSTYKSHGGPGSVYLQDTRNTRPYKQLLLDNEGKHWDQYFTLDEGILDYFFFHEVHLIRNVSLRLPADGVQRNITIQKIHGDRTGRLHLLDGHTAFVEKAESSVTTTKTPLNIWIDEGAKAFMATLVYILGTGEVALHWNGEMIGVQHLRIVPGRVITLGFNATTSSFVDNIYVRGDPLNFEFSSFELGSGSFMPFPTPMGMKFTVSYLVGIHDYYQHQNFTWSLSI